MVGYSWARSYGPTVQLWRCSTSMSDLMPVYSLYVTYGMFETQLHPEVWFMHGLVLGLLMSHALFPGGLAQLAECVRVNLCTLCLCTLCLCVCGRFVCICDCVCVCTCLHIKRKPMAPKWAHPHDTECSLFFFDLGSRQAWHSLRVNMWKSDLLRKAVKISKNIFKKKYFSLYFRPYLKWLAVNGLIAFRSVFNLPSIFH